MAKIMTFIRSAGRRALLAGATALFYVATAFALVAALLNATVGLCLGCEMYLLARRIQPARS